MKEIRDILAAYDVAKAEGRDAVLATVVHVEGSSYRKPGARMLVTDDGRLTGAISGGCLEGDALRKALMVLADGRSRLVTYDTSDEDDFTLGVQLGCNGVIHILIEPIIAKDSNNPVMLLRRLISNRSSAVLVTLFSLKDKVNNQAGTCLLADSRDNSWGAVPASLEQYVRADMAVVANARQSMIKTYTSGDIAYTAFVEWHPPVIHLVVAGAGNDAFPLVTLSEMLGWTITVTDGRNTHANTTRFSSGCNVVVSKPEALLQQMSIDEYTVAVLMSHNYNYDLAMLRYLVNSPVSYIGMLGPRKKYERMKDQLADEGQALTAEQESRIYAPVGLDIGAESPEEIAVSVIAEISAVFASRKGGYLREMATPIHDRASQEVRQQHISPEQKPVHHEK